MSFKKEELIVIALASFIFLGFIFLVKPSTTGFVIHTTSNYIYNSSAINLSNNEIKLIPIITTTNISTTTQSQIILTSATQSGNNKLSKVDSLNNGDLEIKENEEDKILDLNFSSNLEKNDIISVYLTHNKNTNINVCQPSNLCSNQYADVNYDGNQGYRNFTLNLSLSRNTFGIFPTSEKIKVDYIYATHFTTVITTNTTTTYPSQASIETQEIQPVNIDKFDYINYTESLNNQTVQYEYSSNSGVSWNSLINKNLSSLNLTKIKIKIILNSNTINTPIISNLSLLYTEISETTNTKLKDPSPVISPSIFYTTNSLNASSLVIASNDNNVVEIVFWNNTNVHFGKNITNILNNSYASYTLNNNITNKFSVNENWTVSFLVFDGNRSSNWVNASVLVLSNQNSSNLTTFERILIIPNNVSLKIYSDFNISNITINLIESNLTKSDKSKIKTVEIIAPNLNFNSALLRLNYTDSDIININESTLKAHYFNETSNLWEELNSAINLEENYIEFNLTHFSVYGIFGDSITLSGSSNSGSSSTNLNIDRAPSSKAQEKTNTKIEIQILKKQEPKEIKLFAESTKEEKNNEQKPQELITSQVVKDVKPINYLGLYIFVILIIICYLIYHFYVKTPILNSNKTSSLKTKKNKK